MVAGVQRGGILRFPERVVGDDDIDQRVEAVVPEYLRIGDRDHVDTEEHTHEVLIDVVVDGPLRLRATPGEVEQHLVPGAGEAELELVWTVAHTVVTDVVRERQSLAVFEHQL